MGVSETGESVVATEFIGVDDGVPTVPNVLLNHRDKSVGLDVRDNLYDSPPASFDHARNDGFPRSPTAPFAWAPSADVGFVNFHVTKQDNVVLGHEGADLLEHPPGRLVGDSQFPLKLLGRYARASGSHEEHGVEPRLEGSGGLVEDGVCRGGYVGSTEFAAVDLPASDSVVAGHPLTLGAGDAVGPASVLEEV